MVKTTTNKKEMNLRGSLSLQVESWEGVKATTNIQKVEPNREKRYQKLAIYFLMIMKLE